jgi:hypothetical protein
MRSRALRTGWAALPLACAALACGESSESLGSVMLAISTDMYIDKDVSRVDIIIQPERGPTQTTQFNLFPALDGKFLPGTFAIVEGSTPGEFVRVRIIARQENTVRVVREAALRVPRQRTALLSMPIQWLCNDHVRQEGQQLWRSNCDEGETCGKGVCEPDAVDETALPDYEPADVFGGGNPTGGGTCFDTVPCFEVNTQPELDTTTCVLETEVTDDLNVAIRLPPGSDGHCTNAECWIPLDASPETGWHALDGGARVQLPAAVCEHVASGASVRTSRECPSKAVATPTCGPWTLVGTEPGGEGDIEGAPLVVSDRALSEGLLRSGSRVAREVAGACAAITETSAPEEPTAADVAQLCAGARGAVAAVAPLDWYHVTTRCWPDHDNQLACERACDESCDPGTLEDRCEPAAVVGKCDEPCDSRQCLGSSIAPADCPGACDGTCTGSCGGNCLGECDGVCANVGSDGHCAGQCTGTCRGLCQGRCEGTCQGTCDGDPNLPIAVCAEGNQCRGGCTGEYTSPVCHSPLVDSPCGLDAECAADCRATGTIGVACEPSTSWVLPKAGLAPALRANLDTALAALIPVRDVEGPALLEEASRIGTRLQATAASSGDPIGSANALVRIRDAAELLEAAATGADAVIDAAGPPRDTPGGGPGDTDCTPHVATGSMPLIDDFEDGNPKILVDEGRDGSWNIVRDNSEDGQLSLSDPPVPESGGVNESNHAMHLVGQNFTEWGAGLSVELRARSLPYDASVYGGLKFWARGAPSLRVILIQQSLATGHACATCPMNGADCGSFYGQMVTLTDTWTEFSIPWGELMPATSGTTPFAPDELMLLKFEAPAAEEFEFWLDDVSFY